MLQVLSACNNDMVFASAVHRKCMCVCRGELGAEENAAAMSSADVHTDTSGYVLHSSSVSHSCTGSYTSPLLHSNQPQDFKEHL